MSKKENKKYVMSIRNSPLYNKMLYMQERKEEFMNIYTSSKNYFDNIDDENNANDDK
jgi:23S rRNA maturation-related 3'-5' exoribonuclease YhaM